MRDGERLLASQTHPSSDYSNLATLHRPTTLQEPMGELNGSYTVLFYTCLTKKMTPVGEKGKNVRLWDQLQSTVWDKSIIPCENGSHSNLWIGSRLHWFKLWLMELNKRPVLGTDAEAHQTRPNWTGAGLAWWYNRATNYQGFFQLAWCGLVLCYYGVCSVK